MQEGNHVTDFGYIAKLQDATGKVIAAAPMSIDAVTRGYACSSAGNSACFMLNITLSFEAKDIPDGTADGKLSLCHAKDLSAKPEDAVCESLGDGSAFDPLRVWQYLDLAVTYAVKDRKIEVTKYAGMPGDPNGENILLLYHPAFAFAAPGACEINLTSPLVLDLSGDGKIALTSPYAKDVAVNFDWRGNGKPERTGWVAGGDGFLVLDGVASDLNGKDLFGEFTRRLDGKAVTGKSFPNGFEALAQLDANADGKIDAKDPGFSRLKVWIDRNQNGKAELGEMTALADVGIVELSLERHEVVGAARRDGSGNEIWFTGSFKTKDGASHLIADVWFKSRHGAEVAAGGRP